jgi:hypothetical protein
MGGMTRLMIGVGFLVGSCAEEPVDELLPHVFTDLQPGVDFQYLRAETLDAQGELAAFTRWLRVRPACQPGADGRYDLGTFSIKKSDQAVARIRLVALHDSDGKAWTLVEQRIDAVFQQGSVVVPIVLSKVCSESPACMAGTTCDPDTGGCTGIPRLELPKAAEKMGSGPYCLERLDDPPEVGNQPVVPAVLPDAGPPPSLCVHGDGQCFAGCDGSRDSDCLLPIGARCGDGKEACRLDTSCQHGFCCDQPCQGVCERCDLPDRPGRCTPLTYSETKAPMSSLNFAAECSDRVRYTCVGGACHPECQTGRADCDQNLQENGCETALGDALNCERCGDVCNYGYCGDGRCVWHPTSTLDTATSGPVEAGQLYSIALSFQRDDKKVRALGALVNGTLASRLLRLALYYQRGTVWELFAQSGELAVVDNPRSKVETPSGVLRVEGAIPPKDIPLEGSFKIAFQVSETTHLFAASTQLRWSTVPLVFGEFPRELAPAAAVTKLPLYQVYAISTPN